MLNDTLEAKAVADTSWLEVWKPLLEERREEIVNDLEEEVKPEITARLQGALAEVQGLLRLPDAVKQRQEAVKEKPRERRVWRWKY